MESFLTTKTVVGEAINVGDVVLVPLVEVSFGVAAGAYDSASNKAVKDADVKGADGKKDGAVKDAGGGGLGAKITPSAVIVISNGSAKLINVTSQLGISKLLDLAPDILSKIPAFLGNKDKKAKHDESDGKD
jgi:uncharacterized spore protein YtfJ